MPAVSKKQQAFMGMVRAYQKGELKDAPKSVKQAAKSMTKKEVKKFAQTPRKGLPEKSSQTLKEFLLDEGVFSFMRGAGAETGRKIAGSTPIRAVKDVVQAGRQQSARSDLDAYLKKAHNFVSKHGPAAEKLLRDYLSRLGTGGKIGWRLYQRGKGNAAEQPDPQGQSQQPPQQQTGQSTGLEQRPRQAAQSPLEFTPQQARGPRQTPRQRQSAAARQQQARPGKRIRAMTDDVNYDDVDQVIEEGIGAFFGGAAKELAKKGVERLNAYADSGPGGDILRAGKAASAQATILKIAKKLAKYGNMLHDAKEKQVAARQGTRQ